MPEKKKILIVDDEPQMIRPTKIFLEANGFDVITALDGEEGLNKARTENPDIILLDLMLPKIDGHKVCGLLKCDSRYSRIPIIMFTARESDEDIKLSQDVGANEHVVKTTAPKELLAKIRGLVRG